MGKREPRTNDVYAELIATTIRGQQGDEEANAVAEMLQARAEEEARQTRKTPLRPSEVKRPTRRLNISFPTSEWREAVLEQAEAWGVRTSDFLTFCVAYTMAAIESGELRRAPRSGPTRFYHRAGEALELPWSPGDWTEEKE